MQSFFPLDVLDEIWDFIESVSEGFLTYVKNLNLSFTWMSLASTVTFANPGPEVIKLFPCSTQLKIFLLMNVKMPTTVGILTFMSRKIAFSAYLSLKNAEFLDIFILMRI